VPRTPVIRLLKGVFVTLCLGLLILGDLSPGHSGVISTISFNGQASGVLSIDGSGAGPTDCTFTGGGPNTGAAWAVLPTDQSSADGTFNFGVLTNGDGSIITATTGLRIRGNSPCHITASCNQAGAFVPSGPFLRYNGVVINSTSRLARCIALSNQAPMSGGARANLAAYSSAGTLFTGANTLNSLTNAAVPLTGSTRFCRFTSAPSTGGTLTSADNYVEVYPQFSTDTGAAWGTTGGGPASNVFVIQCVFGLFPN